MGKVMVISSGKGGTGKSTVTAGLGAALVRRGNRVLLIDCDAGMRGIDLMLGVSGELVFDIADIFNGLMAIPNCISLIVLSGVVAKETKTYFEKYPTLQ